MNIHANDIPSIASSTQEERENFIRNKFPCISDCDACGICAVFHGKDAVLAYKDYIEGKREFVEVSRDYRKYYYPIIGSNITGR